MSFLIFFVVPAVIGFVIVFAGMTYLQRRRQRHAAWDAVQQHVLEAIGYYTPEKITGHLWARVDDRARIGDEKYWVTITGHVEYFDRYTSVWEQARPSAWDSAASVTWAGPRDHARRALNHGERREGGTGN
jgi:hypothetical protein